MHDTGCLGLVYWDDPEEWIRKLWYIYTMEYYSAISSNEVDETGADYTE